MSFSLPFYLSWFSHNPVHKMSGKCQVGGGSGEGRVGIPYNTPLGSKVPGSVSSEICDNFFSDSYFYMRFFATC